MSVRKSHQHCVGLDGLLGAVGYGLALGIIALSLVPLTGYAGQISLAPLAFGGLGALVMHGVAADGNTAAALQLRAGEMVLRITRLRSADDEPLALQEAHLPTRLIELSIPALERSGSLYGSLEEQFGIKPVRARQTIGARLPTRAEVAALGIGREQIAQMGLAHLRVVSHQRLPRRQ